MVKENRKVKLNQVEVTFNFQSIPRVDREYLKYMLFELQERTYNGLTFDEEYPDARNFTLFNDHFTMINYMSEFAGEYASTASHILNGEKYWLAWTYTPAYKLN